MHLIKIHILYIVEGKPNQRITAFQKSNGFSFENKKIEMEIDCFLHFSGSYQFFNSSRIFQLNFLEKICFPFLFFFIRSQIKSEINNFFFLYKNSSSDVCILLHITSANALKIIMLNKNFY